MTAREILIARFRAAGVAAPERYADATLLEIEANGLVVVPRKATEAMKAAPSIEAVGVYLESTPNLISAEEAGQVWDAMIDEATKL